MIETIGTIILALVAVAWSFLLYYLLGRWARIQARRQWDKPPVDDLEV